jgi:hypothetical protein
MGVGAAPHSTDHQSPENWTLENSNCKIYKRVPECLDGSQCLGSQEGFELDKALLDRIQMGL